LRPSTLKRYCKTKIPGYDPWKSSTGYYFDVDAAMAAVRFFHEDLTHVKGRWARNQQQFKLEPWQVAIIGNLFGWKSKKTDLRRYREAFIFVARKNGKTPLAAGVLNYMLFEDGEPGAEIYGAATEYKQATLVFEHARGMVLNNPRLHDVCKIYSGQAKAIQLVSDYSTYRVIASDDKSSHGFNTHAAVIDELHTQQNRDLTDALMTSTGARDQPLILYITTSDFDREGSICNEKHDYACKVRDGFKDAAFLPVIFEADPDDDWTKPATWKKANPNLGVSVSREYLKRECKRAQETASFENTFKRLHCNIRTQQDVRWLQMSQWDICDGKVARDALIGRPCYAGLDLASTIDIAAFILLFPEDGNAVLPFFWVPADNAHRRERKDKVWYETWARQGLIELTLGNVLDYDRIRARIVELGEDYEIRQIAVDRWNSTQLQTQLQGDGFEVMPFGQGFASMSAPTKELERLILACELSHGGNPVLRWMASNVSTEEDPAGNLKPSKKKSTEKIDGIVALIMALGGAMLAEEEGSSIYNERGFVCV
jgi:phage terminase large subunit-like protein